MNQLITQETRDLASQIPFGDGGAELKTFGDVITYAEMIVRSNLAPKGYEKPESVVIAVQMGAEVGMTPMASLRHIAVINGRPSLWGDGMLAVCMASGVFDHEAFTESIEGEGEKMVAFCTVRRKPDGLQKTKRYTVADAKKAGLWSKSGPWTNHPKRMLQMRARAFLLRDTFADYLGGMLSRDEEQEVNDSIIAAEVVKERSESLTAEIGKEDAPDEWPIPVPDCVDAIARNVVKRHGADKVKSYSEKRGVKTTAGVLMTGLASLGVTEKQVFAFCQVKDITGMTPEVVFLLKCTLDAIKKDSDATTEIFGVDKSKDDGGETEPAESSDDGDAVAGQLNEWIKLITNCGNMEGLESLTHDLETEPGLSDDQRAMLMKAIDSRCGQLKGGE